MPKKKIKPSSANRFTVYLRPEIIGLLGHTGETHGLSASIKDTIERYHELLQGTRTIRGCRQLEGLE